LTGVQLHCQLLGLNYTEFIRQLSYSYWERIIGDNRVIFADSAIRGRYHIISIKDGTYSIIEGLRITEITSDDSLTIPEARKIIDIYEQIRGLLDHNHCYIVETVSTGFPSDVVFAVQVHRGVDFKRASFALSKESDVIELDNVRGSTNPEGEELMLTINYPSSFRSKPQIVVEGASTVASKYHVHPAFTEIMLRRRRLQLFPEDYLREELGFHIGRNLFFKPNCSAIIPVEDLKYLVGSLIEYNTRLVQVPVHFVSDGNIAQIRLIGTEQQSL